MEKIFTEYGPIYPGSYVELLNDTKRCTVSKIFSEKEIELLEYPGKLFLVNKDVKPIYKYYKVYFFNGFYIFAENKEEAKNVWNSWIKEDNSEYKYIEDNSLIKEYKRLKTQIPYPCITNSLDFDDFLYVYKK